MRLIVSGGEDHTVKIWDVTKHCVVTTYLDHLQPVNAVRWSPDGTCIASCSNDKKIKIFDIRSGRIIQHYDAHSAPVLSLSYHPSGNYLVSSSLDSTIKIWDVINGQILYTMHGHEGSVNSVAFSRDGDFIASGGADTTLMVWKNNLQGIGYEKSKTRKEVGISKPVMIPKKRAKSKKTLKNSKQSENKNNMKTSSMTKNGTNSMINNPKSVMNSQMKSSNMQNMSNNTNIYSNSINNNMNTNNYKSMSVTKENIMALLPPEMKITFEKLISQLDLVAKTMKIMDQRVQCLESQISVLYNRQRKGFIQQQPPELGNYEYLLVNNINFVSNYFSENKLRNLLKKHYNLHYF